MACESRVGKGERELGKWEQAMAKARGSAVCRRLDRLEPLLTRCEYICLCLRKESYALVGERKLNAARAPARRSHTRPPAPATAASPRAARRAGGSDTARVAPPTPSSRAPSPLAPRAYQTAAPYCAASAHVRVRMHMYSNYECTCTRWNHAILRATLNKRYLLPGRCKFQQSAIFLATGNYCQKLVFLSSNLNLNFLNYIL